MYSFINNAYKVKQRSLFCASCCEKNSDHDGLLFDFRDYRREVFTELTVPPYMAGVIGTFNCAFFDVILIH